MSSWRATFWTVWVANLVTAIGMQSFLPFFAGHLESLGVRDPEALRVWTGLIYGAAPLVAGLLGPLWGMLGDRMGRKVMVLRAMAAITLFVGGMALARSPFELLLLRIGQGMFSGFVPPSITLASLGAPADRQGRVAGSISAALAIGSIAGPFAGAGIGELFGTAAVFYVTSALSAVSFLLVLFCAHEVPSDRARSTQPITARAVWRGFAADVGELTRSRPLLRAVLLIFFVQLGLGASNPLLELFARDLPGSGGKAGVGLLFGALAAAGAVAMPLWGRYGDRVGHSRALEVCAITSGVALALHALAPGYRTLLAARVALGLTAGGVAPVAFGVAAAETPIQNRGAAFGTVFSARALAVSGGASVGGAVAALLGIRSLFAIGAVVIWLAVVAGRLLSSSVTARESES